MGRKCLKEKLYRFLFCLFDNDAKIWREKDDKANKRTEGLEGLSGSAAMDLQINLDLDWQDW